ncbi:MAG: hypothetical protein P8Y64_08315 [Gammaproteobacteria bacterium]
MDISDLINEFQIDDSFSLRYRIFLRASCILNGSTRGLIRFSLAFILLAVSSVAIGSDLEDLARDGYAVIEKTQVDGDFDGCDFGRRIPLMDGLIFVCSGYGYSYAFMPEVLILKNINSSDIKILINGDEYDGYLYRRR